ncbi:MAG: branched-chain amino acid ABC transporter permease [Actinobacteria bacterium]|nr:branched-chain amino acid ABC transporter permease [Actinomycetota bacterium]
MAALVVAAQSFDAVKVAIDAARAALGVPAATYALASVGLNVQFGYTGLLNFGHVAFLLVGAYGTAVSVSEWGLPLWLGVLVGVALAVVLALLVGLPTLRLRADYLAIVTIAIAEILRYAVRSRTLQPWTGGTQGLQGWAGDFYSVNPIPSGRYGIGRLTFDSRQLWVMTVGWGLVALTSLVVWAAMRSPWGRVLRAIREDEDVARSLGKNVVSYKMQSLVLGGVIGALAGMVLSIDSQFVDPTYFVAAVTFYAYAIVILGGRGHVAAPVIGSVVFWFLFQLIDTGLREAIGAGWISPALVAPSDVGAVQNAVVGIGLMAVMVLVPQGIVGTRSELLLDER